MLVISHEYPPLGGGAGLNLQSVCGELINRGYNLRIITERFSKDPIDCRAFPIIRIPCLRKSHFQTSFISTALFLAGAIVVGVIQPRKSYDFIFSNMAIPAAIAGVIIAALRWRPHMVWHHGSDVHAGRSLGAPVIQKLLLKAIWRRSFANCFISAGLLARAQTYGNVPRAFVVPVAPVFKNPPRSAAPIEKPCFLFMGRLEKVKNPLLLIDACDVLKKRGDLGRPIRIIGDGRLYGPLRDTIARRGLESHVVLQKNIAHAEIAYALHGAYALIITSIVEGFNMTMLEAAMRCVPTISSDVAGVSDFIKHRSTGLLFKTNDPIALADCMKEMDNNLDMRRFLGNTAFDAAQRYSLRATVDALEIALESMWPA